MNKKGFTLIELLSVIVILSIILVIAVPSVLKIREDIRKKSITSSALLFYKSVDLCISTETDYTKCNTNTVLSKYYEGTLDDIDLNIDQNGNITTFKYDDPSTGYGIALNKTKITKEDISNAEVMNTKDILDYNIVDNNTIKFNSIYNTTFNKFQIKGNIDGVGNITNNLLPESTFPKSYTDKGIIGEYEGNGIFHIYGEYKNTTSSGVGGHAYQVDLNLPFDPSAQYTLSSKLISGSFSGSNLNPFIGTYSNTVSHTNWIRTTITPSISVGQTITSTIPGNYYMSDALGMTRFWIYWSIGSGQTFKIDCRIQIWLEKSNKSNEYEPYNKYKIPITISGKNLISSSDVYDVYSKTNLYSKVVEDDRNCVKFTSSNKTNYNNGIFKENTQYTISFDTKSVKRPGYDSYASIDTPLTIFYTDGTYSYMSVPPDGIWYHRTFTTAKNKTVSGIGTNTYHWKQFIYVDVDTFQIEESTIETKYEPYIEPITANIYLDQALKTNGDYTDYIDFKTNTVTYYDSNGNSTTKNINLPNIPIYKGTTIINWE